MLIVAGGPAGLAAAIRHQSGEPIVDVMSCRGIRRSVESHVTARIERVVNRRLR